MFFFRIVVSGMDVCFSFFRRIFIYHIEGVHICIPSVHLDEFMSAPSIAFYIVNKKNTF